MTQTSIPTPRTSPPTDTEWYDHARWSIPPVGTRRQLWVAREAQAIFTARTGRADPWPDLEDYRAANAVIPREEDAGRTDLDDVGVLPVHLRNLAHPLTWALDEDTEGVALECEYQEDVFELDTLDGREATDGSDCPSCGRQATRRVIVAWTPRAWDRPVVRP